MASTASGHVLTASQTNRSGSRERSRNSRSAGTAARTKCRKSAPICRKKGLIPAGGSSQIGVTPHPRRQLKGNDHVPLHHEVARDRLAHPRRPDLRRLHAQRRHRARPNQTTPSFENSGREQLGPGRAAAYSRSPTATARTAGSSPRPGWVVGLAESHSPSRFARTCSNRKYQAFSRWVSASASPAVRNWRPRLGLSEPRQPHARLVVVVRQHARRHPALRRFSASARRRSKAMRSPTLDSSSMSSRSALVRTRKLRARADHELERDARAVHGAELLRARSRDRRGRACAAARHR